VVLTEDAAPVRHGPAKQRNAFSRLTETDEAGKAALKRAVVIKLNGGLGTSMGLERAKSLLPVRDDLSFLDLIARQVLALRSSVGTDIPLLLMNSFRTAPDTEDVLAGYPGLKLDDLPLGRQLRHLKVVGEHDALFGLGRDRATRER